MRWLSQLVVILALSVITLALPTTPAQAVCVPWGIELSPKYGPPGTSVTVSGHDFSPDKLVDIYYDGVRIVSDRTDKNGDFTVTFTIPEGCRGYYEVRADIGYTEVHTYFAVKPGLTIAPQEGPPGTTVTVTGQGFAKNEDGIELWYYTDGGYQRVQRGITANAKGSWQTSFQIPPSTRGSHRIDAEGATSRHYDVKDAIFRVTSEISLDKSSGTIGETITVTGARFGVYEKDIKILFDGQAVLTGIKANSKGEWEVSLAVPEMPAGNYSVTAQGEQTKREDIIPLAFEIKPKILLSPNEGHVGTNLTVTGQGFAAREDIVITYNGERVATTKTDNKGSFAETFVVPPSQHGQRVVAARYSGEKHVSAIFVLESHPPPAPSPISPDRGSRLGLLSGVTPTLKWIGVSDESGVRYSLQIATSPEFTQSSLIVSVTDLSETSYGPAEALPNGTYYWRTRAVDGADNESEWSTTYFFRVGLLPKWGFIAIIVGVAALLLVLLIRAIVRRRSIYYDRW